MCKAYLKIELSIIVRVEKFFFLLIWHNSNGWPFFQIWKLKEKRAKKDGMVSVSVASQRPKLIGLWLELDL